MASNFLGKWWSGAAVLHPEVAELQGELQTFLEERATWKIPAAWLLQVLPQLLPSEGDFALPQRTEQPHALQEGMPFLSNRSLDVAPRAFYSRWRIACEAYANTFAEAAPAASETARAARSLQQSSVTPAGLTRLLGSYDAEDWTRCAQQLGLPPELLSLFLRFTIFPWLYPLEQQQASQRPPDAWQQGRCPTCGQPPLLAELRGLESQRFLRCGWCTASWSVPRIFCPFCEHHDHRQIRTLREETPGVQRSVSRCDLCGGYVKTFATLWPLSARRLWFVDGTSTYLDVMAGGS